MPTLAPNISDPGKGKEYEMDMHVYLAFISIYPHITHAFTKHFKCIMLLVHM